jgi:hypothetical protein
MSEEFRAGEEAGMTAQPARAFALSINSSTLGGMANDHVDASRGRMSHRAD